MIKNILLYLILYTFIACNLQSKNGDNSTFDKITKTSSNDGSINTVITNDSVSVIGSSLLKDKSLIKDINENCFLDLNYQFKEDCPLLNIDYDYEKIKNIKIRLKNENFIQYKLDSIANEFNGFDYEGFIQLKVNGKVVDSIRVYQRVSKLYSYSKEMFYLEDNQIWTFKYSGDDEKAYSHSWYKFLISEEEFQIQDSLILYNNQ